MRMGGFYEHFSNAKKFSETIIYPLREFWYSEGKFGSKKILGNCNLSWLFNFYSKRPNKRVSVRETVPVSIFNHFPQIFLFFAMKGIEKGIKAKDTR
jgi:hypothetical protein